LKRKWQYFGSKSDFCNRPISSQSGLVEIILAPVLDYTRITAYVRKLLFAQEGIAMSTITTIGAIIVFFVVIGFALKMIKELFKSK
jgi:hypothetical protein